MVILFSLACYTILSIGEIVTLKQCEFNDATANLVDSVLFQKLYLLCATSRIFLIPDRSIGYRFEF